ncbi:MULTISPECIES: hypothetical protein [Amycolatopsis]|uniref:Uncharacterized protein n=1 Tax=Amycolatopsis bullii TaxID=941987 RepID=A0ABQ3K2P8_9PSEU|nr:hypothetical protein [Amycolatopsis bullii]GHF96409.1 hypothetical protein GCM10017567_08750 [Amycolatopsis bullii]
MKVVDGYPGTRRPSMTPSTAPPALRRGPLLVTAVFAALGGAAIPAAALPALWRVWQLYAMLFGAVAAVGIVAAVAVLGWPTRKTAHFGALASAGALVLWVVSRPLGLLTRFDAWQPADTIAGFTDYVAAGLQVVALYGFLLVSRRRAHPWPSAPRRVLAWIVLFPVLAAVLATAWRAPSRPARAAPDPPLRRCSTRARARSSTAAPTGFRWPWTSTGVRRAGRRSRWCCSCTAAGWSWATASPPGRGRCSPAPGSARCGTS